MKKLGFFKQGNLTVVILASVILVAFSFAEQKWWFGWEDGLWTTDNNWGDTPTVPSSSDLVGITAWPGGADPCEQPRPTLLFQEGMIADVLQLRVGQLNFQGTVRMEMSGGTITTPEFFIASECPSITRGQFIMTGGTINSGTWFCVGDRGTGYGYMKMTDGVINTPNGNFIVSSYMNAGGHGEFDFYGGEINCMWFLIASTGSGTGHVDMRGDATVNVRDSDGSVASQILTYAAQDKLTAYGLSDDSLIDVSWDSANSKTTVTCLYPYPIPNNGSGVYDLNTDLRWACDPAAGDPQIYYDVYFGTDPVITNNPKVVNQSLQVTYQPAAPLVIGTNYYWRVDSYQPAGTLIETGDVWTFTAINVPLWASNPIPADGAVEVEFNAVLSWDKDPDAISHKVYFSDVKQDVENGTAPMVSKAVDDTSFDPFGAADMDYGTEYFWRVDEVDSNNYQHQGDVWSFTTIAPVCTRPAGDLTDDCIVNLDDFAMLAGSWLGCGWDIQGMCP